MTNRAERLLGAPERRSLALNDFQFRSSGNTLTFTGYASLFDTPYEMYGGPDKGGWMETVDQAAFNRTLSAKPDVVLLINHDGLPLARTSSGTLELRADKKGLRSSAQLDSRDPDVQRLQVKMERRDLSQMSMAFRTNRQEWNGDETERRLLELNLDKGDVSVVNNGASPTTHSTLRSLSEALSFLGELDDDAALAEVRGLDDPLVALRAAEQIIGRLVAQVSPVEEVRRYSVAHAKRLLLLNA